MRSDHGIADRLSAHCSLCTLAAPQQKRVSSAAYFKVVPVVNSLSPVKKSLDIYETSEIVNMYKHHRDEYVCSTYLIQFLYAAGCVLSQVMLVHLYISWGN